MSAQADEFKIRTADGRYVSRTTEECPTCADHVTHVWIDQWTARCLDCGAVNELR